MTTDACTLESTPLAAVVVGEAGEGVAEWSDARLVEAVRHDPPDRAALDALAERHWKALFGRCQLLTLDRQRAADLAQEAWCRVLRSRHRLKPEGNFPAYLAMIALNLWRDACRADQRAGPMAERRLASLDAELPGDDSAGASLADILPDLASLEAEQRRRLAAELDDALARLEPHLRGVVVARFLAGESCAVIAQRHGRTEQTVSGWVRQAVQALQLQLLARRDPAVPPP